MGVMDENEHYQDYAPGTRFAVLKDMFGMPDEEEDIVVYARAPSGRPPQAGKYAWKNPELQMEKRDLAYLEPKRLMTTMMDAVLASRDPISASQWINFDGSPESLQEMLLELQGETFQTNFFQTPPIIQNRGAELWSLLNHDDERVTEAMHEVVKNYITFLRWLGHSGYDFVFGPLQVPNVQMQVDDIRGVLTGGRVDGVGVKFVATDGSQGRVGSEALMYDLQLLNLQKNSKWWPRNLKTVTRLVRAIAEKHSFEIENLDVLEYKLGERKSYNGQRHGMNVNQLGRYCGTGNEFLGLAPLGGKLIYFGNDIPIALDISPKEGNEWAEEAIRRGFVPSMIKEGVRRGQEEHTKLIEGVAARDPQVLNDLLNKIVTSGQVTLQQFVALSYLAGYKLVGHRTKELILALPKGSLLHVSEKEEEVHLDVYSDDLPPEAVQKATGKKIPGKLDKSVRLKAVKRDDSPEPTDFLTIMSAIKKFGRRM